MKVERTRDTQTQRVDREKQGRTLIVPEGKRPEKAKNGVFLFDGKCFCIRSDNKWETLADISATDDLLKRVSALEEA